MYLGSIKQCVSCGNHYYAPYKFCSSKCYYHAHNSIKSNRIDRLKEQLVKANDSTRRELLREAIAKITLDKQS